MISHAEVSDQSLKDISSYFTGYWLTDLSNMSSYIYHNMSDLNWVGFYFFKDGLLQLGPFNGKPACMQIKVGHGVCGTSYQKKEILRVDDVDSFPGHIRCDSASKSELVLPILFNNKCLGVLDLDSPILIRFNSNDVEIVQAALNRLLQSCGEELNEIFGTNL